MSAAHLCHVGLSDRYGGALTGSPGLGQNTDFAAWLVWAWELFTGWLWLHFFLTSIQPQFTHAYFEDNKSSLMWIPWAQKEFTEAKCLAWNGGPAGAAEIGLKTVGSVTWIPDSLGPLNPPGPPSTHQKLGLILALLMKCADAVSKAMDVQALKGGKKQQIIKSTMWI